jgi:hypothetical protein
MIWDIGDLRPGTHTNIGGKRSLWTGDLGFALQSFSLVLLGLSVIDAIRSKGF